MKSDIKKWVENKNNFWIEFDKHDIYKIEIVDGKWELTALENGSGISSYYSTIFETPKETKKEIKKIMKENKGKEIKYGI